MTEFKCLKAVFMMFNFLEVNNESCAPNNLLCYYTEKDVSTRAEAVVHICALN